MDNYVTVVIRRDVNADGPYVIEVFQHYSDAELWRDRQADPQHYILSQKKVRGNG